jgi:hypothetical protein
MFGRSSPLLGWEDDLEDEGVALTKCERKPNGHSPTYSPQNIEYFSFTFLLLPVGHFNEILPKIIKLFMSIFMIVKILQFYRIFWPQFYRIFWPLFMLISPRRLAAKAPTPN